MTTAATRLALGTVQFGLAYGATNAAGQVPQDTVRAILDVARAQGIDTLDTAAAYGTAESVLGTLHDACASFRIVTKTLPHTGAVIEQGDVDAIETAVDRSRRRLNRDTLDALLVHHGANLLLPGARLLFDRLAAMKARDWTRAIGVSVYRLDELAAILDLFTPDLVQLPCNLLDQRFLESGMLGRLSEMGVEVHARSLFLQGTLLAEPHALPSHLAALAAPVDRVQNFAQRHGLSRLEACLGFGLAQPGIARLVMGVTSVEELAAIVAAAESVSRKTWPDSSELSLADPLLTDPSRWPKPAN